MVDRRFLHAIAVPEQVLERPRGGQSERVASAGALSSDVPAVESVSPDAPTRTVAGVVGGVGAELTATELEELFGASGIKVVPMFGDASDPQVDGYYATEDVTLDRPAASQRGLQSFDGRLTRRGSRRSHRRALRTNPTTIDNPFGSDATEEVAIPARAAAVQWFDDRGGTGATEDATAARTVSGQHDDIAIYDATDSTFTAPALVYDVAYRHEWPVDVRVWDTRGDDRRETVTAASGDSDVGTATVGAATVGGDATEYVGWQRVYRTDHDAVGTLTLENDRLQVRLDEGRERLVAARWNTSDAAYERVQLDVSSDWRFQRADVRYIGAEAVDAQLAFSDGSSSHRLNASLKRGYDDVQFANPANAGTVPAGLVTRLDAIAATSEQDPAATADIIPKAEVGE